MLSNAKHLAFSSGYEVEILRLRLRMTLRHSLLAGDEGGGISCRACPVEGTPRRQSLEK